MTKQSFTLFFLLLLGSSLLINADNGDITDFCPVCERLVDDFTEELNTTAAQDVGLILAH
jgi:hypothetical protein